MPAAPTAWVPTKPTEGDQERGLVSQVEPTPTAVPSDVGPGIRSPSAATSSPPGDGTVPLGTPVLVRTRQPLTLRIGSRVLRLREGDQVVRLPEGSLELVWEAVDGKTGVRREIRRTALVEAGRRGQELEAPFFTFDGLSVRVVNAEGRAVCVWIGDRLIGATMDHIVTYVLPGSYPVHVAPRTSGCLESSKQLVGEVAVGLGGGLVPVVAVVPVAASSVVGESRGAEGRL